VLRGGNKTDQGPRGIDRYYNSRLLEILIESKKIVVYCAI
jgi:hypothetical protein